MFPIEPTHYRPVPVGPTPELGPGFRFVDLFCGIGGFREALEDPEIGGVCVFSSDIDADCRTVYATRFGEEPFGDIRRVTDSQLDSVPDHDVLCAGFPCQPFSKSGRQLGMEETRGTLFWDILRILEARRPSYVILENVRNLAGPRQRETWETIIRQLRLLGYQVSGHPLVLSPHLLPAELGGRPQVRERVFIVGKFVGEDARPEVLSEPAFEISPRVPRWNPRDWSIDDWLQDDREIPEISRYALRPDEVRWIEAWNELLGSLDASRLPGFPIWADAFVTSPRISAEMPEWKRNFLLKNSRFYLAHKGTIDGWLARHQGLREFPPSRRKLEWQAQDLERNLWKLVLHFRPSGIRVKRGDYLPALVAITQTSIIGWRRRRITPREAARLQGFPDDFPLHPVDSVAYRQLGNAVSVGIVRYVIRALRADANPSSGQLVLRFEHARAI